MKKKPSNLNFSKTVSDEYAAERKREESARSMQQEALKLRAAVVDAFGIWNDVWDSVESCHAGREVYIGEQLCDPIALLAKQLDQMLAAIVGLYGEDKVRLAFNQFSVDGYQDFDLDAARTVKILLEVFVALLDGAKSKAVSQELYQLSPLPHLCGAKALVSVVQSADRLPIVCQCGRHIGYPFDADCCDDCSQGSGDEKIHSKVFSAIERRHRKESDNYKLAEVLRNGPCKYQVVLDAISEENCRSEQTRRFHAVKPRFNKAIKELGVELERDNERVDYVKKIPKKSP